MNIEKFKNLPLEMREKKQWVLWKSEVKATKDDPNHKTKVPYRPNGKLASSTNPEHWNTYEKAVNAYKKNPQKYSGIGFVFNNDFVGIDLDHCFTPDGTASKEALGWIETFGSYAERSQSGNGLHIITKGKIPDGKGRKCGNYEMYTEGRFFVVTGDSLMSEGVQIIENQPAIDDFHHAYFQKSENKTQPQDKPQTDKPQNITPLSFSDDQVITLMWLAKNSNKIKSLMDGDKSGYPSQSEADLALCSCIAFYTQDASQVDRIFRSSGLYRAKWDKKSGKDTYGSKTIQKAIAGLQGRYEPEQEHEPEPEPVPVQEQKKSKIKIKTVSTKDLEKIFNGEMEAPTQGFEQEQEQPTQEQQQEQQQAQELEREFERQAQQQAQQQQEPKKAWKKEPILFNYDVYMIFQGKNILANFLPKLDRKIENDSGAVSWEFSLWQGTKEKPTRKVVEMDANCLAKPDAFRLKILEKEFYAYSVQSVAQHMEVMQRVIGRGGSRMGVKEVHKTQYLGKRDGGFLFHNAFVQEDGTKKTLDDCGIIPPSPSQGKKMCLYDYKDNKEMGVMCQEYVGHLQKILGDQSWKSLGFSVATLFLDSIVDAYGQFPIQFFSGKTQSGKSSIAISQQTLLGCHKAIPETAFGTPKAIQRTGSKFKNCLVLLNEFKSDDKNNVLLCQLHDREGYQRAKKDNSLDTDYVEINSAFSIIGTTGIVGTKAEDTQNRLIEINSDLFHHDVNAMDWIKEHSDKLSCFVPFVFYLLTKDGILEGIKETISGLRAIFAQNGKTCEERVLKNHAFVLAAHNLLMDAMEIEKTSLEDAYKQIERQTQTAKQSDLGLVFLQTLKALVMSDGNGKYSKIAKIMEDGTDEVLIFSLQDSIPFVRQQGKSSDMPIADTKTIGKALKRHGCTNKVERAFGAPKHLWTWKIEDDETT